MRWASSRERSTVRWTYRSPVTVMVLCPSCSIRSRSVAPWPASKLAQPWRRSWNRRQRSPRRRSAPERRASPACRAVAAQRGWGTPGPASAKPPLPPGAGPPPALAGPGAAAPGRGGRASVRWLRRVLRGARYQVPSGRRCSWWRTVTVPCAGSRCRSAQHRARHSPKRKPKVRAVATSASRGWPWKAASRARASAGRRGRRPGGRHAADAPAGRGCGAGAPGARPR
jgi:hypothetical protein